MPKARHAPDDRVKIYNECIHKSIIQNILKKTYLPVKFLLKFEVISGIQKLEAGQNNDA